MMVLAMAATLSGCFGPPPTPTTTPPTASEIPTEIPTETSTPDPMASVVALVARPKALELRDADGGVVMALDYMSVPSEAIAVLTDLLDAPPVDESYRGTNHTPPGVFHAWDDLVIDERFYDEDRRNGTELDYIWPRFAVYFDEPTVQGLDLTSEQGFHAADPWSSLDGDPVFDASLWTCVGTPIETLDFARPDGQPETATVVATPTDDGSAVKRLGAPVMLADGCA
ncbi:hypothetical protein [Agromyces sp. NPDC056965]|uniref:hypothetical protein n=1 Tax=Agromyces sp. NPDC056965 TaxID=3345983 RepID=UPI00363A7AF8